MNKMYLVLGDWSDDGHGKFEKILVEVNKTVEEVQNAYKASCKLTGIAFDHDEDYTETNRGWKEAEKYRIAVEYEDSNLSGEVLEILTKFGCPLKMLEYYNEDACQENYVKLWFWFINLSLPYLEYEIVADDTPNINGYWSKNLNASFGYGLF